MRFFKASSVAVVITLLVVGMSARSPDGTSDLPDGPFISGCVGECANSFSDSYTVTQGDYVGPCGGGLCDFYFYTPNGVCPNTEVHVVVKKNGSTIWSKYFVDGVTYSPPYNQFINANAFTGDVISVTATMGDSGEEVTCKRLGNFDFDLEF